MKFLGSRHRCSPRQRSVRGLRMVSIAMLHTSLQSIRASYRVALWARTNGGCPAQRWTRQVQQTCAVFEPRLTTFDDVCSPNVGFLAENVTGLPWPQIVKRCEKHPQNWPKTCKRYQKIQSMFIYCAMKPRNCEEEVDTDRIPRNDIKSSESNGTRMPQCIRAASHQSNWRHHRGSCCPRTA